MSKFDEVYEDTLGIFTKHIESSMIPREVKIKILSNESIKKGFGKVSKTQDIFKFMTGYDIIIQINEYVFDMLQVKQKEYVFTLKKKTHFFSKISFIEFITIIHIMSPQVAIY